MKGQGLPTDGGGVTLMAKVKTNGPSADPAYLLAKAAFPGDIGWNFGALFLFDGAGAPLARYGGRDLAQARSASYTHAPSIGTTPTQLWLT